MAGGLLARGGESGLGRRLVRVFLVWTEEKSDGVERLGVLVVGGRVWVVGC